MWGELSAKGQKMNFFGTGKLGVILAASLVLSGCDKFFGELDDKPFIADEASLGFTTGVGLSLSDLLEPQRAVDVAVYTFPDKTGQQQPNDDFSDFSKAVTQGGEAVLIDVLRQVADGDWFRVVERSGLNNLLNERQIIDRTTQQATGNARSTLGPLRFAGIILEGGIVEYDSNFVTGGAGVRYLGIGPSAEHRKDLVTVALRAVSVDSGEVLSSVTTTKTVYSRLVQGSVFTFVAVDEILEIDVGFSINELTSLAVREAIELAVFSLIIEGARDGIWQFEDKAAGRELIQRYDDRYNRRQIALPSNQPIPNASDVSKQDAG
jgi:curli production assembly/transport component CsgG